MVTDQQFYRTAHWIAQHFAWQEKKLAEIHSMLAKLEQQLTELRQQKETRIGRVEYKFDQLKVEKLEGTLNVGMSAPGGTGEIGQLTTDSDGMDSLAISDQAVSATDSNAAAIIRQETERYIRDELPGAILRMAGKYGIVMDNEQNGMIAYDVKRQLAGRTQQYMTQYGQTYGNSMEQAALHKWAASRIREDVEEGLRRYFARIGRQQGDNE